MVVRACHTKEGYNHIKGELTRIFGDKRKKKEKKKKERNQAKNNEWVFCVWRRTLG